MEEKKRYNIGCDDGRYIIEKSINTLGYGRSVLVDKDGNVISGHEVYNVARKLGHKIVTIETSGDVLLVVKRTDLSVNDTKGMEMSFIDNFSQEKNLCWNTNQLLDAMSCNFSFDPRKWGAYECLIKELNLMDLFREDVSVKEKKDNLKFEDSQLSLF